METIKENELTIHSVKCKICSKILAVQGLGSHLKNKHRITPKEYYDTYFKKDDEGICPTCGKETNFKSITEGYHKFCCISCSRQFWTKDKDFCKKVGRKISENWKNKSQKEKDEIASKRSTTYKNLSEESKQKLSEKRSKAAKKFWKTLQEEERKLRCKQLSDRQKQWWKNLPEEEKQKIISRQRKSQKEFYKNETEEDKKIRCKKIKSSWKNKSKEELEEYKKQCSTKGQEVWTTLTEEEYKRRCSLMSQTNQNWWNNASNEEIKQRCDNMSKGCKHRKYTKNKLSKAELNFIKFLNKNKIYFKFNKIIDDRYPFRVDFYISKIDLFIELNIFWHHGKMPYTKNSKTCKQQLNIWKENSQMSDNYKNAIHTWTIRDVEKRKIAKKNKLNYIELFSKEEIEQYKKQLLEEIYDS